MKVSFLSAEENQELFGLRLAYDETKKQMTLEKGRARQFCQESFLAAEIALWRFFQRKLSKVMSLVQFAEFFEVAKKVFGQVHFSFELKESFDELLEKFREFIKSTVERIRKKLKKF
jgi:hypothetical protein